MSKEVTDSLKPLFEEAEEKGLWFYQRYYDLWLSPSKLKDEQKNGRFRWGAANWRLRDPKERLQQLRQKAAEATQEADNFEELLGTTTEEASA